MICACHPCTEWSANLSHSSFPSCMPEAVCGLHFPICFAELVGPPNLRIMTKPFHGTVEPCLSLRSSAHHPEIELCSELSCIPELATIQTCVVFVFQQLQHLLNFMRSTSVASGAFDGLIILSFNTISSASKTGVTRCLTKRMYSTDPIVRELMRFARSSILTSGPLFYFPIQTTRRWERIGFLITD